MYLWHTCVLWVFKKNNNITNSIIIGVPLFSFMLHNFINMYIDSVKFKTIANKGGTLIDQTPDKIIIHTNNKYLFILERFNTVF